MNRFFNDIFRFSFLPFVFSFLQTHNQIEKHWLNWIRIHHRQGFNVWTFYKLATQKIWKEHHLHHWNPIKPKHVQNMEKIIKDYHRRQWFTMAINIIYLRRFNVHHGGIAQHHDLPIVQLNSKQAQKEANPSLSDLMIMPIILNKIILINKLFIIEVPKIDSLIMFTAFFTLNSIKCTNSSSIWLNFSYFFFFLTIIIFIPAAVLSVGWNKLHIVQQKFSLLRELSECMKYAGDEIKWILLGNGILIIFSLDDNSLYCYHFIHFHCMKKFSFI